MSAAILSDEVWTAVAEFVPASEKRTASEPGRRQLENRATLSGILFVLMYRLPWNALPVHLGFGSGATCYRRLREWQKAGAWQAIKNVLICKLTNGDQIAWWRADASAGAVRSVMRKRSQARRMREQSNRLILLAK